MYKRKKCSRRGRRLSVDKFFKDKSKRDGYRSECKNCGKKQ